MLNSRIAAVVFCAAAALGSPTSTAHADAAQVCGPETYRARGVIKAFTEDRKLVNIAHEKIEGYMIAMTMTFEPRSQAQIAALRTGDRIRFVFTVDDDGRRVLDQVTVE